MAGHGGSHGGEIGHGSGGVHGDFHGDISYGDSTHGLHTPHGMLPGGVLAGGSYTAAFVSHDSHGHSHVSHSPHGEYSDHTIAQTEAHILALQVAMQHGCHELKGFSTANIHNMPMFHARQGNVDSHELRMLNLPGTARDDTTVEILYWPHAKCSPKDKVRAMAQCLGMKRIKPYTNVMTERDETHKKILSNTPFGNASDKTNPPNGWYRRATGTTHLWQEYFQLQPCKLPWPLESMFGRPKFETWRTFLIVFGVTWHYAETDDYETRIAFTVFSLAEGDTYRWDQIRAHRVAAEKLAAGALKHLGANPAAKKSIDAREAMECEMFLPESAGTPMPRPKVDVVASLSNIPVMPRVQLFNQAEMPERQ